MSSKLFVAFYQYVLSLKKYRKTTSIYYYSKTGRSDFKSGRRILVYSMQKKKKTFKEKNKIKSEVCCVT